jgi:LmbE family N-acetylglucosaminyl deacetylase
LPIGLDELPGGGCSRPTIMNIVAHQDDDLLFISPDLLHDIKAGHCIRTVYVTAGDAGSGKFFWLSREQASEAAYSEMLGVKDIWIERIVKLSDKQFVTIANPRDNPGISLVFMHLPDGNLKGEGFGITHHEALEHLRSGSLATIHAIDGQSAYSSSQLTTALSSLMHFFSPTEIRTQANLKSAVYPDHSDHLAVGNFVKQAYKQYEEQQFEDRVLITLKFYVGYPIHSMPANVQDGDLAQKQAAYFAYAAFDGTVCHSIKQCDTDSTFGGYLARQYQNPY